MFETSVIININFNNFKSYLFQSFYAITDNKGMLKWNYKFYN
jgi:hypothetical protein